MRDVESTFAKGPASALQDRLAALGVIETWLARHAAQANPMAWSTPVEAAFRRKCFAELGFVVTLAEAMGDGCLPGLTSGLLGVRESLLARVDEELISLAHRSPDRASILAFPMAFAVKAGTLTADQTKRVRDLLTSPFAWGIERLPYRYLDLAAACTMAGGTPPIPVEAVIRTSSLAMPPDPFTAPKDALYALTHAAFFTFLLNGAPLEASPDLAMSFHGSMRRAIADNDLDLGLELVLAARLCGLGGCPAEERLINEVTATILDSGVITACLSDASGPFVRARPSDAAWAGSVHIMQVAALALRARLVMPSKPTTGLHPDNGSEPAVGAVVLAIHHHDLKSAADRLIALQSCEVGPAQKALLNRARRLILGARRPDGGYGHFGDDRRAFSLLHPGEDFDAMRAMPAEAACQALLDTTAPSRNHF